MKKIIIASIIAVAAVASILYSINSDNKNNQPVILDNQSEESIISKGSLGSFAFSPTFESLTEHSDLIIIGKVVEMKGTRVHPGVASDTVNDHDMLEDYAVNIERVIKKDAIVKEVFRDGDTIIVSDEKLPLRYEEKIKVGERYVLFIGYTPEFSLYIVYPFGKYLIQDAKVYTQYNDSTIELYVKGMPLEEFLTLLQGEDD